MPRDAASRDRKSPSYAAAALARLRPLRPWWAPLTLLALVLGSAPFAIPPIRDAASLGPVTEAALGRPAAYVLLAPFSNVLDLLTLLSVRQHIALLVTLMLGYALWWWGRGRVMPPTVVSPARRAARVASRLGLALLAV
ncbi:MAG TPA: hypothetical protein VFN38_00955, partial [Gemmatimonadaceae bacterium]|nr:hypothetical protein [Gemmatimonadaceae bacterium]